MTKSVVPYNPNWQQAYRQEAETLRTTLGDAVQAIHHIGSTSIPGMRAKPIIDILLEVRTLEPLDKRSEAMVALGYEVMGAYGIEGRRYFRKINDLGVRTHHVHAFDIGSRHIERHLAFRDYLIAHPEIAKEYSALKARLTKSASVSWDAYLDGKDPFIKTAEKDAVRWLRSRSAAKPPST